MKRKTALLATLRNLTYFNRIIKASMLWKSSLEAGEGYAVCEITEQVHPHDEMELDHAYPFTFERIVWMFLKAHGLKIRDLKINFNASEDPKDWRVSPQKVAYAFRDFHNAIFDLRANRRLVHRDLNREMGVTHRMHADEWAGM